MDASPRSGVQTRSLPTGTVSFLFTDIQGSTELLHKLGDQAYGEVLLTHQRLLRQAFTAHEGAEVDTQGDAFFVAFPRAWNAIAAAVAAQRALAAHPWPEGVQVRVRMGIHTGEPTLAGDHYVGLDVHRAARIAATGYGGQVLLSERSHVMAASMPDGVEVRDLGEHRLKDIHRPEHIYQLVIPELPADFPPLKSLEILVTNLPALQVTSFVGRGREMAEITSNLAATRLLTLLGPGGTGKTRLALQVGSDLLDRFPKGVWLVELAPVADPEVVVATTAAVFNVREAPGRPLLDSLIDYLKPRALLLILDNCEHLIGASAQLANTLLRACPQLRILATSREPLGVPGEMTYRVQPMSRPDPAKAITADQLGQFEAAQLFIERALASNPQFIVSDRNAPAVSRVVHRLDGIPLAIELAAARVKVLSVEQIAARLDDRFRLLTAGARTGLPHHQTLQAAIDWSHDLLGEAERILFRRLSVFAGGFSLTAAEEVCAGGGIDALDVLDLLARLVDKSLVMTEARDGDVRYRMLETIREYGRARLLTAAEEPEVRERHLRWHVGLAEDAEAKLQGPDQTIWLDRLEQGLDDLRAALDWALAGSPDGESGLRLAGALHRFWTRRGYLSEGRERVDAVLARAAAGPTALRAKVLQAAAALALEQGDSLRSAALAEEALALARAVDDTQLVCLCLNLLGVLARNRGDYEQAGQFLGESERLGRLHGHTLALAETLNALGVTARRQRDNERARVWIEHSLALWRELGDKWGLAAALGHLGVIARNQGDYARARALHDESLALRRELGDRRYVAVAINSLATVVYDQGDYERARALFEESLAQFQDLGARPYTAATLGELGMTVAHLGDLERAEALLAESLRLSRDVGDKLNTATALSSLGMVAARRGKVGAAAAAWREALDLFGQQNDRLGVAECLVGLARIDTPAEGGRAAAELLGAAAALRQAVGAALSPAEQAEFDGTVAAMRTVLGADAFQKAWEAGQAMTLADAVQAGVRRATANMTGIP